MAEEGIDVSERTVPKIDPLTLVALLFTVVVMFGPRAGPSSPHPAAYS